MAPNVSTAREHEPRARYSLADRFYYLNNFQTVLASLTARYVDLLSIEEQQFLADFERLPKVSRALLVRMVMRKGDLFRASRLHYLEIGEPCAAVAPLLKLGWVDDSPSLDMDQLQRLLPKAELVQHFQLSRLFGRLDKAALIEILRAQHPEAKPFRTWCQESGDCVYQLKVAPLCERFRLMFFGNFHQDWTEFVLTDLGLFVYEKIPYSSQSRPFSSRAHIDAFHQLSLCRQYLDAGVALNQVLEGMPPPLTDSEWLEGRRQKLLFEIGRAYERSGELDSALAVLTECTHRGARIRRIRLLERARDLELARDLCLTARENPENAAEGEQLSRLVLRLNRKLGVAVTCPRTSPELPAFEIVLDRPNKNAAVEYCMRDHLARQEGESTAVHYVENGLVNSMFGLLCWKAIFAPMPGAFFHDFQDGPGDLSSGQFFQRRHREFAECFAELESHEYQETIRRCYSAKAGIQSPFVAWRLLSSELLDRALMCFPAAHLRLWFDWISRDPENRAGFPDLVQFWPLEQRYRMIEVKGPGDRLQDNQRRLLEFCASHDMPVSVCYVRWAEPTPGEPTR